MCRSHQVHLAAVIAVLFLLFSASFADSLLSNGDMEEGSPSAWLKGGNIDSSNLVWASDEAYSGSYSLKIVDHSTNAYGAWFQSADLPAGADTQSLKINWFWKYDDITNGVGFNLAATYYQTNAVISAYSFPCKGSSDWVGKQLVLSIPDGADQVRIIIKSAGDQSETGTIWLDDVSAVVTNMPAGLARVDVMPDLPSPYLMRDWKQVARDYDDFVFDFSKTGDYLPLIWWDTTRRNFDFDTFGMPSYVGHYTMTNGANHEAINCIAAVLGASLCGVDKSNQGGTNWVAMLEQYFNSANGENLVLNRTAADTGNTFWYDTYSALLFCQLLDLYPDTGGMESEMEIMADRFSLASEAMGGSVSPWTVPDFEHTAFDFDTTNAVDNGKWCEPDIAAAYGWIDYMAWVKWGNTNHLNTAFWAMDFLQQRPAGAAQNPFYEILLPYGAYLSARMNAELGTAYDTEKLLDWVFGPSEGWRNGWGVVSDEPWGGYDCDGLVGGVVNGGGYAFAMNTFDTVGALVPMVRYDDRYALPIAKWVLNAANASRLFYSGYLPATNQTGSSWATAYDPDSCMAYEGLRRELDNATPMAMGAPLVRGTAGTDFALYGASHVGLMAACIETSNVPGILQIDLLATDFYHAEAYPTYLYFNPHETGRVVQMSAGTNVVDVYDSVANKFLHFNVSGTVSLDIDAKAAVMPVLIPAGVATTLDGSKMLAGGVVADYQVSMANISWQVGSGYWDEGESWAGGVAPGIGDEALFNYVAAQSATIRHNAAINGLRTYFNNKTITVNSGATLLAGATYLGLNAGSNHMVNVSGTLANSGNAFLGYGEDSVGSSVNIGSGGICTIGNQTYIGYGLGASSTVNVNGGSYVGTGALRAGYGAGSEGLFKLNSGSASFNAIYAGIQNATASGAVEVNGGTLTAGGTYIGFTAGTSGSFTMTDGTANLGVFRVGFQADNLTSGFLMSGGTLSVSDFWLGSQTKTGEVVIASMSGGVIDSAGAFVLAVDDTSSGVDFDFSGGEIYASGISVYNLSGDTQDRISFSGDAIMYLDGDDTAVVNSYNIQGFMIADENDDGVDDGTLTWGYDSANDRTWVAIPKYAVLAVSLDGNAITVRSETLAASAVSNVLQMTGSLTSPAWSNVAVSSGTDSTNWAFPVPTNPAAFFRMKTFY